MKLSNIFFSLLLLTFISTISAQDALLSNVPDTKEGLVEVEKNVLATIKWLEETPMNQEQSKRKEQYSFLVAWLTKSPNVSIELHSYTVDLSKKNNDMLIFFMAGWARHSLTNNYSTNTIQGNLAGIKLVLDMYEKEGFKKDKNLKHLQKLSDNGKLEDWVREQLK